MLRSVSSGQDGGEYKPQFAPLFGSGDRTRRAQRQTIAHVRFRSPLAQPTTASSSDAINRGNEALELNPTETL
jgi:hypothetical protein